MTMLGNNYNVVPASLPGTPSTIASFADRYGRMAEALNEAVKELRILANENVSISLAVDEVRARAEESIDVTRRVALRYEGAGNTLNAYQASLAAAQAKANAARSTISSNNPRAAYWRNEEDRLTREILFNGSDPTLAADLLEASKWVAHYDGEFSDAMAKYHAAEADRDAAVNHAIAGLNDASEAAGLNDNFFEAIEGVFDVLYDLAQKYLAPLIEILRTAMEIVKQIVDILALIVSILAIFIPVLAPLAAALTVISLVLGALILLCSLVLFALGKETIGRVIGDAINFAAGLITAKMGGVFKPSAWTTATGTMGSRAAQFGLDFVEQAPVNYLGGSYSEMAEYGGTGMYGTPAWGSPPPFSMDGFDGAQFGEVALSVGTGGIYNLFNGDLAETWNGGVDSGVEFWGNVGAISAVPAG